MNNKNTVSKCQSCSHYNVCFVKSQKADLENWIHTQGVNTRPDIVQNSPLKLTISCMEYIKR